ncbi:hypothetical protein CVT26_014806 [Gymnopilus dilepis]|uniref:Uncharacterized protein n=1 Tax=Gymnopilus dilepis TaxID=231916 RepID=A0A409W3Y9_9AGAR|nr:hypothetical protein CVT26_014806 [Gymnopilus dilepis]
MENAEHDQRPKSDQLPVASLSSFPHNSNKTAIPPTRDMSYLSTLTPTPQPTPVPERQEIRNEKSWLDFDVETNVLDDAMPITRRGRKERAHIECWDDQVDREGSGCEADQYMDDTEKSGWWGNQPAYGQNWDHGRSGGYDVQTASAYDYRQHGDGVTMHALQHPRFVAMDARHYGIVAHPNRQPQAFVQHPAQQWQGQNPAALGAHPTHAPAAPHPGRGRPIHGKTPHQHLRRH